jgi:papilin
VTCGRGRDAELVALNVRVFGPDPYGENCPDDESPEGSGQIEACEQSMYGCCPDRVSFAKGPDGEGCSEDVIMPMTTTATVPERTSVPVIGDDDSVEDAITDEETTTPLVVEGSGELESADHESGCARSTYGCCLDGVTAARGPQFEGCTDTNYEETCVDEPYGCCPDGVTSALGPGLAGCGHRLQNAGKCVCR